MEECATLPYHSNALLIIKVWRSYILFYLQCKIPKVLLCILWPPQQSYELTEELTEYGDDTLRPLDSSLPRRSCGRMLKVSWVSIKVGKRTGDTDSRVQSNARSCSSVLIILLNTSRGPHYLVWACILGVLNRRKLCLYALWHNY